MTLPEAAGVGLGFLAIVAPEFWPKMPRPLSFTLAAIGLGWLTYSLILGIEAGSGMKLAFGPIALIVGGAVAIGAGGLWHFARLHTASASMVASPHLPAPTVPEMPVADVVLRLAVPGLPVMLLDNQGGATAKQIKRTVALWNLDDPPAIGYHQPLPIPVSTFDFIRAKSTGGPLNLLAGSDGALLAKPGNRLFGSIGVVCPDCARGHTYFVFIKVGEGGWYTEVTSQADGAVFGPRDGTPDAVKAWAQQFLDQITPADRIEIKDL